MKAIVNERFGSPEILTKKEVEKPIIDEDEVLIETYSTSVNKLDIVYRSGMKVLFGLMRLITGIRAPRRKILGFDISGKIIEVGENVSEFKTGDIVFGGSRTGANAEYAKTGEASITLIPSSMSFVEAGVMPVAALSALQGLSEGEISGGQDVLIYGASGGIGTYAVQIAKSYGATVTGVASGKNEGIVRELGADNFIDYTKEDFTQKSEKYDLIYDTVAKSPQSRWKKALKDEGIFVNAGSPNMSMLGVFLRVIGNKFRKKQYRSFTTKGNKDDLMELVRLVDGGELKSVIDRTYTLDDLADAHRYYEQGHTVGKIAVIVRDKDE